MFDETIVLACTGAVIGPAASGFGQLPANQFFEIGPIEVKSFVVAVAVLGLAVLAAKWLSARRAKKVAPIIALRHE